MLFYFSCSATYFFVYTLGIVLQICFAALISYVLVKEGEHKEYNTFDSIASGCIKYTPMNCLMFIGIGFGIGTGAIIFGLGGASIMNPVLILLGFDPLVLLY